MHSKPVRQSVRRIRKFLKKASDDPVPDKVHDLRTGSRRLEAVLQAFGFDAQDGEKKLLADLRRIRKKAGKVRDMDVLTENALGIEAKPEEQDCLVEVIEYLGASRGKQAKKLHAAARKIGSRLRRELKQVWSGLEPVLDASDDAGEEEKQSRVKAVATEVELARDLRLPLRLNRKNLHPYRLKVKDLRYILQLEDRRNQKQFVEKLGEVKDAIGEWHDWEELTGIASKLLDHGARCKLLQTMKSASDAKYKKALQVTLDMRKTYVAPAGTKPGKSSVKRATLPAPITIAV